MCVCVCLQGSPSQWGWHHCRLSAPPALPSPRGPHPCPQSLRYPPKMLPPPPKTSWTCLQVGQAHTHIHTERELHTHMHTRTHCIYKQNIHMHIHIHIGKGRFAHKHTRTYKELHTDICTHTYSHIAQTNIDVGT